MKLWDILDEYGSKTGKIIQRGKTIVENTLVL